MRTSVKLYSLNYRQVKTYLFALLFIAGNILFPRLCHLVPKGGLIFLPIYFFTLIGSYKYGFQVGLLTGVFSPIVGHLLFGMPPAGLIPLIIVKSIMLAGFSACVAHYSGEVSLWGILAVVFTYQLLGMIVEWIMTADFVISAHDFTMSIPGMLLQIFGGYALLKRIEEL